MKILIPALFSVVILSASAAEQPNILLLLVDDLGWSDVGCYGSEIETPVLDKLARNGLRFSSFYSTAKCHSSRVSLLSGRWCRQAGDESLKRAVTLPEMLQPAGYFTAMTGKWHLSKEPTDFGFDRYWGHLSGATNFFRGDNSFRLNGAKWEVPKQDFYTTVANADFALKFLAEARQTSKPWMLYMAFNAPHSPLQCLQQDYEKYAGRYAKGWDAVYAELVASQRGLNLFGRDFTAPERPGHLPAWKDLPADHKAWEEMRMTTLAAMIDRVDQEIGRVVADLERSGELDNTHILFFPTTEPARLTAATPGPTSSHGIPAPSSATAPDGPGRATPPSACTNRTSLRAGPPPLPSCTGRPASRQGRGASRISPPIWLTCCPLWPTSPEPEFPTNGLGAN